MSDHTLIGRPAARLEMIVLVIRPYVLVYIVGKSQWLSTYECNFLIMW